MNSNGILISITGIDGSGKSTQISMLQKWLEEQGYKSIVTKMSSRKTDRYKILRNCVTQLKEHKSIKMPLDIRAIIMAFENLIRVEEEIIHLLSDGYIVITDRYSESTDIYLECQDISNYWPNLMLSFIPKPDVYIYIDVSPEISYQRILKRNEQMNRHESIDMLEKLRNSFLKKKELYNYDVVDGADTQDVVFGKIKEIVLNKLHVK